MRSITSSPKAAASNRVDPFSSSIAAVARLLVVGRVVDDRVAAVALDHELAHAASQYLAVFVAGIGLAEPGEDQLLLAGVDGAMRPAGRDEGADAGLHLDGADLALAG